MTSETVLELLHRGKQLVAEIPASTEDSRAFVGVNPIDLTREGPHTAAFLRRHRLAVMPGSGPLYYVRCFEVERAKIEADVWLCEDDLSHERDVLAIGDDDLIAKLGSFGVRLDQLVLPFDSDYPI